MAAGRSRHRFCRFSYTRSRSRACAQPVVPRGGAPWAERSATGPRGYLGSLVPCAQRNSTVRKPSQSAFHCRAGARSGSGQALPETAARLVMGGGIRAEPLQVGGRRGSKPWSACLRFREGPDSPPVMLYMRRKPACRRGSTAGHTALPEADALSVVMFAWQASSPRGGRRRTEADFGRARVKAKGMTIVTIKTSAWRESSWRGRGQ